MQTTISAITLAVVIIAVCTDVRWGKIYNWLTLPALGVGLTLNLVTGGVGGGLLALGGIGVVLVLFLLSSYLGRILGGGDIKLLAAVGALQGTTFILYAVAATMLIGGVLALMIALRRRILRQRVQALAAGCYLRAVAQVPMDIGTTVQVGPRLPYAVAICLGTVTAMLYVHVWHAAL
jgi:prepilin peptidase CpaA